MAIDRSKFKASSQADVAEQDKAMATAAGKGRKGIADTLEIELGENRFRIYPAHPDGGGQFFAEAVSRVFLPAMVQERDSEGKGIKLPNGQWKLKKGSKPVFNSRIHGNTAKDLVEEYSKLALAWAEANLKDPEKKKAYLNKINGIYSPNAANRLPGLKYKLTYEMYADKLGAGFGIDAKVLEFGRLAVSNDIKEKMNKVGAFESSRDPLGLDPWSDPERGLPVVITKQAQAPAGQPQIKPADIYGVTIDKVEDRTTEKIIRYPIPDANLEKFLEFPSLFKLFRSAFKKSDFELQLAGLEMFDQDYQIGIFHTDEFLNIAEEISGYYSDEAATNTETEGGDPEQGGDVDPEEADEPQGDLFTTMTRLELKNYITKEKLGITFKQITKDEEIRELIRTAVAAKANGGIGADLPKVEEKPAPVAQAAPVTTPATTAGGTSAKDRLAALKKGTGATA